MAAENEKSDSQSRLKKEHAEVEKRWSLAKLDDDELDQTIERYMESHRKE